jgi:L-fuconolactonase
VRRVIDAHHHLWDIAARDHRWLEGDQPWATDDELARLRRSFTLADLAPLAAASGVTGTVVIQAVTEPWETSDLLALAAGTDPATPSGLLLGVVGWTDLADPAVADALAALRALPGGSFLSGIRHPLLAETDPDWLARPAVRAGLQAMADADLSFDLVLLAHQLPAAAAAARSVPDLSFVVDHLGGPSVGSEPDPADGEWAAAIRSLAALPNVTCKLSGVHTEPARAAELVPYYDVVLEAFGPGRLMFGSDWPVSSLGADYAEVVEVYRELTAALSTAERDAIFERTARRVYRL